MTEFVLSDPDTETERAAQPPADPQDAARLALFGHDLRAALSDVVGGLRLIDAETLAPLTRAQIERVRVSAEGLAQLLDRGLGELLGEGLVEPLAPLNLQRFLTDLDLRWSGRGLETGTAFTLTSGSDLPAGLRADRVTLDRVLSNLIGNAFKYAARRQVRVEVTARPDGGVRLAVRDDGPGFSRPVLDGPPVFHSRPPGSTGPGSGMGLHIVADLLHRIGGRLTLQNLAGGGAEALVDLPADLSEREMQPDGGQGLLLSGRRVLVADDSPTSQTIAASFLRSLGAAVVLAFDGVDALARLEGGGIDMLLVDVQMPRLSGLDVIRTLRKLPGAAGRMPVVALTAHGLPSDRAALLAAGADEVLTKPLMCPQALASTLRQVLDRRAEADPEGAAVLAGLPPVFEGDRLQRLLDMAGPETGRDLLDRLVSDLDGVRRGLTAAVEGPDWKAVRSHSHVLISLAGAVGGLRLQSGAEALNQAAQGPDAGALRALLPGVMTDLLAMIAGVEQVRHGHAAPR